MLNSDLNPANNIMASGQDWSYDAAGNVITDLQGRSFIYDAENKQVEVENALEQSIGKYWFDGDGKRIKKEGIAPNGQPELTVFVYDAGGKLIGEYSTNVETQAPKVQYLTADHLGSPRINTDQNGTVTSRTDYMPYGEEIIGLGGRSANEAYSTDDIRKGFTGYENDKETGLDFAQARMYARNLGRFTASDPIKFKNNRAKDPQRINLYAYVRNSPYQFVDPDGRDVNLVNKTEEQREKALQSILVNMADSEAANVGVRFNESKRKYEVFIKDAGAVDMSKASKGYSDLVNRVGNKDLQLDFTLLGKNDTVNIDAGTVSHGDLISPGGFGGGGFVQEQNDGSFAVIVAEGGFPDGVDGTLRVCKKSDRSIKVPFPDFIITAHELFSETYKYTPEGKQEKLFPGSEADNDYVIKSENQYRDFHGIPRRNGKDHGRYSVEVYD